MKDKSLRTERCDICGFEHCEEEEYNHKAIYRVRAKNFKVGDKVIIKKGVKDYMFTNAGSIGTIKKLGLQGVCREAAEIRFVKLCNGQKYRIPARFNVYLEDIKLLKENT